MAPRKQRKQTCLTFEPVVASSSSSTSNYIPAKVRYAKGAGNNPTHHPLSVTMPSPSAKAVYHSGRRAAQRDGSGNSTTPSASFMPAFHGQHNRTMGDTSSDDSAAEIGDVGHDEKDIDSLTPTQKADIPRISGSSDSEDSDEEPLIRNPRSSQSVSTRLQKTTIISSDSDKEASGSQRSSSPRKRRRLSVADPDDSDDTPILPSLSARKLSKHALVVLDDSDSDVVSPTKRRKAVHHSSPSISTGNHHHAGRLKRPTVSSPIKRKAHKGHRSEKQKKMELLRRRRAGERIDRLTSSESSSGEDEKRGIYDSDPDRDFEVLRNFDDEEKVEEGQGKERPAPSKEKHKRKREKSTEVDNQDSDLEDFVTDDDDAPLGAPVEIPLEYTSHAHLPLKEQFPYVIEWLVHNRINPAFERRDPVYINAWRKLDDEVSGLANSKFTSAAWKPEFSRALKSRPGLESYFLGPGGAGLHETCEACGRSGHPSTYKIIFSGSAYHKDTLEEVESESDIGANDSDEEEAEEEDDDRASVDTRGMPLPPTSKEWSVGAVCCSNAETAHSLLHWKHALKQWVEERLEDAGWMTGARLREREKMKAGTRRALANSIADGWQQSRVIAALYGDFKATLENARNKATTGRSARGRLR